MFPNFMYSQSVVFKSTQSTLTISYHLPFSCQPCGPLASLCPTSASAASGASTHQQCLHQPKTPPCWHLMCKVLSIALPYASVSSLKLSVALLSKPSSTQSSSQVAKGTQIFICLESVAAFRETCNRSETFKNQLLLFTTFFVEYLGF